MAVIALMCPDVTVAVFDVDQKKIDSWNNGPIPVKEPGLEEVLNSVRGKNLSFTSDPSVLKNAEIIFISVGTPTKISGIGAERAAFLDYVESSTRSIGKYAEKDFIVVEKSTVPVGTCETVRQILSVSARPGLKYQVLSNPEFMAEGSSIRDLKEPDRLLIGHLETPEGIQAAAVLSALYERWVPKERILLMNTWSSELAKLTSNAFLAQRISSINAISAVCEATGANVKQISAAIGKDSRIGEKFSSSISRVWWKLFSKRYIESLLHRRKLWT